MERKRWVCVHANRPPPKHAHYASFSLLARLDPKHFYLVKVAHFIDPVGTMILTDQTRPETVLGKPHQMLPNFRRIHCAMGNKLCMPIRDLKGGFGGCRTKEKRLSSSSQRKLVPRQKETDHLSHRFESFIINRIVSRPRPRRSLSEPPPIRKQVRRKSSMVVSLIVYGDIYGRRHAAVSWPDFSIDDCRPSHGEVGDEESRAGARRRIWSMVLYKIVPLLEEAGMLPIALDLAGSGANNRTDINAMTGLEDYADPLTNYLGSLADREKVILVGHSCGGAVISFAMERFPERISKAIFVSATMLGSAEHFLQESQNLEYGNGREKPPTNLRLEKKQIRALYFNRCPTKDIALAALSMGAVPLRPMMDKLVLTPENYGSVRRFFIQTMDNNIFRPQIQDEIVRKNPPHGVYRIKGSDHSPFLSKPRSLNKILLEIAQL
ncbi:hypothetical protein KSP40_PGU015889 [Platanthera guangdongensis]|uniref:AB hydrolase-1 domain-containing protein n=1 Tax=Platanthera guangdongensis TaxID=2320717 RepID=A0ABR2MT28_9ASPA